LDEIEALRNNEARFRAIFEKAAVGIARVDLDGRWLEVNQRLCDIVGYSREDLMTKTFADITHPDDLEQDVKEARRMLTGEITKKPEINVTSSMPRTTRAGGDTRNLKIWTKQLSSNGSAPITIISVSATCAWAADSSADMLF
jgi:PAS domain S-box-containing protein